jgi:hypothetical protein
MNQVDLYGQNGQRHAITELNDISGRKVVHHLKTSLQPPAGPSV